MGRQFSATETGAFANAFLLVQTKKTAQFALKKKKKKGIFLLFLPCTSKLMLRELSSFPVLSREQQNQWRWLNHKNKNVVFKSKTKWSKTNPCFCSPHPEMYVKKTAYTLEFIVRKKRKKPLSIPRNGRSKALRGSLLHFPKIINWVGRDL